MYINIKIKKSKFGNIKIFNPKTKFLIDFHNNKIN